MGTFFSLKMPGPEVLNLVKDRHYGALAYRGTSKRFSVILDK
jgi:hypothetical protein